MLEAKFGDDHSWEHLGKFSFLSLMFVSMQNKNDPSINSGYIEILQSQHFGR